MTPAGERQDVVIHPEKKSLKNRDLSHVTFNSSQDSSTKELLSFLNHHPNDSNPIQVYSSFSQDIGPNVARYTTQKKFNE